MMSRKSKLLLLSVAFISALLMTVLHILALQNGWYLSSKLTEVFVAGLSATAVAMLLVPYVQSYRPFLTVFYFTYNIVGRV